MNVARAALPRAEAVGVVLWGVQLVAVAVAVPQVPALLQATLTTTASLLLLWLWTRWRDIPVFAQDATLGPGMGLGLLYSARVALLYLAVPRIGAAATVEFSAGALLLHAALHRGLRDRPRALGAALALFVLAMALPLHGLVLAACAALAWVIQVTLLGDARLRDCAGERLVFYQLIGAAVTLPVASVVAGENWLVGPDAGSWWALLAQVGCCVLSLALVWIVPQRDRGHRRTAPLLVPAACAALGLQALLGPAVAPVCWFAAVLLLGAAAWPR